MYECMNVCTYVCIYIYIYDLSMHSCVDAVFWLWVARPLQVSLLGGSLASLGLRSLENLVQGGFLFFTFVPFAL